MLFLICYNVNVAVIPWEYLNNKTHKHLFIIILFIIESILIKFGINVDIQKCTASHNHPNLSKIEICVMWW